MIIYKNINNKKKYCKYNGNRPLRQNSKTIKQNLTIHAPVHISNRIGKVFNSDVSKFTRASKLHTKRGKKNTKKLVLQNLSALFVLTATEL